MYPGLPEAPAIGGDGYEVAAWLQSVCAYFEEEGMGEEAAGARAARDAFVDANPETL
jgi:hypothetical protein